MGVQLPRINLRLDRIAAARFESNQNINYFVCVCDDRCVMRGGSLYLYFVVACFTCLFLYLTPLLFARASLYLCMQLELL